MEAHVIEIMERLARIESKLESALDGVTKADTWIGTHPRECPFEKRKAAYVVPVVVAILMAAALKLLDMVFQGSPL